MQPVGDRAAAQQVVAALRAQHPAAVDDGEPSGTAGRPMLEVLRHQDLDGVLVTMVRYYGGVNLGAGGLVRAYTDCIAQALLGVEKTPIVCLVTLRCTMPYALEGMARREIHATGGTLRQVQHAAQVEMTFTLPESTAAPLAAKLNEASRGQMRWLKAHEAV